MFPIEISRDVFCVSSSWFKTRHVGNEFEHHCGIMRLAPRYSTLHNLSGKPLIEGLHFIPFLSLDYGDHDSPVTGTNVSTGPV